METMGKKYDKLELLDNEIKDERFLAGLLTTRSQACKVVQWEHAAALSENCHPVLFHGRRRSIIPCWAVIHITLPQVLAFLSECASSIVCVSIQKFVPVFSATSACF